VDVHPRLHPDLHSGAGARGYLTKDASRADIAAALPSVARGQATFDARVSARLFSGWELAGAAPGRTGGSALTGLTARERDVSRLIGAGLNNSGIRHRRHAVRLAPEVFGADPEG
jgi:DNA-binding NarL/FixJ family response regulator